MTKRILGIDTGTNSLGWAVVDRKDSGEYELINRGSLIFQEGVKLGKSPTDESSKAAERTSHRALRKQYFRRRLRKIEVLKVLIKYGWCPYLTDDQLQQWHTKKLYPQSEAFMSWQRTNDNLEQNPYYYRHVCLHDELDLDNEAERYMLGRALYHLAQRRGFLSNRLDQGEDKEAGKVNDGISNLSSEMVNAGCEYLGDYFYKLYKEGGNKRRIKSRYTDREEHYLKEFYAICDKQKLTKEQTEELYRALYFVRKLKSQKHGVGKCTLEKKWIKDDSGKEHIYGKRRCLDSHPLFERFRMLQFINSIKVIGPYDNLKRHLTEEEKLKAEKCFYVKTDFTFENIAKAVAGRGKGKYQTIGDEGDCLYKFNYRMSQSVACCKTIRSLQLVFGEDYQNNIAETYLNKGNKTPEEVVCDIWNVLNSFDSTTKLYEFGINKLQLDEEKAIAFSKIKLSHNYTSLSLRAIRKILPFLEAGEIYSYAVMMAKVPDIVGKDVWQEKGEEIYTSLKDCIDNYSNWHREGETLYDRIKEYIKNNFDIKPGAADMLYHPSMTETYADAKRNAQGIYQLGSPCVDAIRNPMAMRSLHQLRKIVNQLLRDKIIDENTEVHVEYARELNDANRRKALYLWQNKRQKQRAKYKEEIIRVYRKTPNDTDIDKFEMWVEQCDDIRKMELWNEQNHYCPYTGKQISMSDFLGGNQKFDVEHTVPRSRGGDSSMMNLTLCDSVFNREIKKTSIPSQLVNHKEILSRLKPWYDRIKELSARYDAKRRNARSCQTKVAKDKVLVEAWVLKYELDYWQGKYDRFLYKETPKGFNLRQEIGIGLISKYAGLYLKSLFHDSDDFKHHNVRVVKGLTTAEFRKMWGIQDEYEKKSRDNHIHHCIDAITIACIGTDEYQKMAQYHHDKDAHKYYGEKKPPIFSKPWPTFTEDIKALAQEMLVVHDTSDNMPKHAKKIVRTSKGKFIAKGDSARGSLHNDTYYGAIEKDGEIRYVKRVMLDNNFKESDAETIVDEAVKAKVKQAIAEKGLQKAMTEPIYMNEDKGIVIKKVRCYANSVKKPLDIRQHRDESKKEYKRQFHVTLDGNYCMAIYEGMVKGKTKRTYEIVNMLEASTYYKESSGLSHYYPIVPEEKDGLKYRCRVTTGTQMILLQSDDEELDIDDINSISNRLYYVAIMKKDGRIILRHHQEAREATVLKKEARAGAYKKTDTYRSQISLSLSDFHALVEGVDFKINCLGNITLL